MMARSPVLPSSCSGVASAANAVLISRRLTPPTISSGRPTDETQVLHVTAALAWARADRGDRRWDQRLGRGMGVGPKVVRRYAVRKRGLRRADLICDDEAHPWRPALPRTF